LLDLAEQGDWDGLSDLAHDLLPALEAARSPANSPASKAVEGKQIEQLLPMLQTAIEHCSTRREQILPLINALIPAINTSDKP